MPEAMNEPLPVGPELDAAVARVLGWKVRAATDGTLFGTPPDGWPNPEGGFLLVPSCSTDPDAAWEIVECLRRRGLIPTVSGDSDGWHVEIMPPKYHRDITASAPTMPEAVCRVVLLAADALKGEE